MTPTLAGRLKELFPEASGVSRKDWLAHGRVTVNGRVVRDGIEHHRDFWRTFEDTPHALF